MLTALNPTRATAGPASVRRSEVTASTPPGPPLKSKLRTENLRRHTSLVRGVLRAVNHGDSDNTGSIAGTLLGLLHGTNGIPAESLEHLEFREIITRVGRWPQSTPKTLETLAYRTFLAYPP